MIEKKVFDTYVKSTVVEEFENKSFEILREILDEHSRKEYVKTSSPVLQDYQSGSLRYEKPNDLKNPDCCFFHIANACQPGSIFDDPAYLPKCFFDLMEKAKAEYGAEKLCTGTWLNSYDRWLALFPKEWIDNMGPVDTDVKRTLNFWGQFINAKGIFNRKIGETMRKTGKLPFYPRHSWCTFNSLKKHLEEFLSKNC